MDWSYTSDLFSEDTPNDLAEAFSEIQFQIGSWDGTVINNGDGTATFKITNAAGLTSLTGGNLPDSPLPFGPGHTVYQAFEWTEAIDSSRLCSDITY